MKFFFKKILICLVKYEESNTVGIFISGCKVLSIWSSAKWVDVFAPCVLDSQFLPRTIL